MSSARKRTFIKNQKCKFMKKSLIALVTFTMVAAATFGTFKAFATVSPLECPGGSKKCCTDEKGVEYKIEVSAQES